MTRCMVYLLLATIVNVGGNDTGAEPPDPPSTNSATETKTVPVRNAATASSRPSPNPRIMIHVDDIGRRLGKSVTLVGRLGKPLATKLELRGRWQMSERPPRHVYPMHPSVQFVVFEVNGSQLPKTVDFDVAQVKADYLKLPSDDHTEDLTRTNAIPSKPESLDGEEWTMTAYETGRFIAVASERGDRKVFSPVYAPDYNQFRSHIIGVVTSIDGEPCDEPTSR